MPPKLSDDATLSFRQDNPKRAGTKARERYDAYKAARTVAEALQLGATRADLASDIKQGHCTLPVDGPSIVPSVQAALPKEPAGGGVKRQLASPARSGSALQLAEGDEPAAKRPAVSAAAVAAPAAVGQPAAAVVVSSVPPVQPAQPAQPGQPAQPAQPSQPSQPSQPGAPQQASDVDLSFAKLDGKPIRFVKRVMGEARRLLCAQGQAEAQQLGYEFLLKDRDNLSKWVVKLRDLNANGGLAKDLARLELDLCVDLELSLPDNFPLEPPFARVLYPQLTGGFVFAHGGICFEPLTAKGWAPSMTLPSLAIAIKGIMDYGEVRVAGVGNRSSRIVPQYTEEGARKDHQGIVSAHRGGESSTYGRQYKS